MGGLTESARLGAWDGGFGETWGNMGKPIETYIYIYTYIYIVYILCKSYEII
jgi:hypothetical protein